MSVTVMVCGTSVGHVFAPLAARCVCGEVGLDVWGRPSSAPALPPVVQGALLEVLTRLVDSVQALHDRLDTLERALKARGSL